jgi:hypothetical protein
MKISQIICHNTSGVDLRRNDKYESNSKGIDKFELLSEKDVILSPEAILFKALLYNSVTETGGDLNKPYKQEIRQAANSMFDQA